MITLAVIEIKFHSAALGLNAVIHAALTVLPVAVARLQTLGYVQYK